MLATQRLIRAFQFARTHISPQVTRLGVEQRMYTYSKALVDVAFGQTGADVQSLSEDKYLK